MKSSNVNSDQDVKKEKFVMVFGILLSETKNGEAVLLIRDVSSQTGFRLPGGKVILKAGPSRQRKREIHNLSKFIYNQSGINTKIDKKAKKPIFTRVCAVYILKGDLIKMYYPIIRQGKPCEFWERKTTFEKKWVNVSELLRNQSNTDIDYQTKIILKDFFKKRTSSHLIPVRELQAVAY
jgi:hypothetical protein